MKERPILFSAPMVRAILDGTKTQTRRAVKVDCAGRVKAVGSPRNWHLDDPNAVLACPFGQPGDRLYAREAFSDLGFTDAPDGSSYRTVLYRADRESGNLKSIKWTPSIHMPRWASRITLEIVGVRVERLQDISEEDAEREGFSNPKGLNRNYEDRARYWFRNLWESINGPGSWEADPFVWVVEFKRMEGGAA